MTACALILPRDLLAVANQLPGPEATLGRANLPDLDGFWRHTTTPASSSTSPCIGPGWRFVLLALVFPFRRRPRLAYQSPRQGLGRGAPGLHRPPPTAPTPACPHPIQAVPGDR